MRSAVVLTVLFFLSPHVAPAQAPKSKEKPQDTTTVEVNGRTLDYWIKELHSTDPSKRETAIRSITGFGPDRAYEAIPDMLSELRKHTATNIVDLSVRVNLCMAIGEILEGVKSPEPKYVQDAVSQLKRQLADRDQQAILRYRAAEALGRIGPDAKSAIEQLINMTRDFSTWETRQIACTSLGLIGQVPKAGPEKRVTDALFRALNDKSFQVRLAAIRSLAWLGGPGDPRVRAMMQNALEPVATKDIDPTVQIWAHMAIMSIGGDVDEKRLATIGNMLKSSKDMGARVQAAQALGNLGAKSKPQMGALIVGLADKEPAVVYWCVLGLAELGQGAMPAVPELQKIMANNKLPEPLRKAAEDVCDIITGKNKKK